MKNIKRKISTILFVMVLCVATPFEAFASYQTTISAFTYGGFIIPAYDGDAYETVNDNITAFTDEQKSSLTAYESYGALDSLGRCTAAIANIDRSLMPAEGESRGSISSVTPTGWVQGKYSIVSGGWLYNRSHLIGWQLTAENANKQNLITGTRYFNVDGMLPIENAVATYIRSTDNHVLYRVTPIFRENNLLADGVIIEAESLEDESINYCIFAYNVQPGIEINYATGENQLEGTDDSAEEMDGKLYRVYGSSRYDTAIEIANNLKATLEKDKFDTIIVACGDNYPDALAGGYLASKNEAPILTVNAATESKIKEYIDANLNEGGKVYILGGTGVVSQKFENSLKGYEVKRLAGANRYDTNLAILEEAGVSGGDILVCSGNGYADSLSASSTGRPILLVNDVITAKQMQFVQSANAEHYYIIGGTGAVNNRAEKQINTIKGVDDEDVTRLAGANRYDTSLQVANTFFGNTSKVVTIAYGQNFPDGLSGGPLAYYNNAPLLLAENAVTNYAGTYIKNSPVEKIYVFGGEALVSDAAIGAMLR